MFWPNKTQREFPEFSTWLQPERWPEFLLDLKEFLSRDDTSCLCIFAARTHAIIRFGVKETENATDEKYDLKVWYGLFVFTWVFHLKFNKFVILVLSYRICDLLLLAFLIGVENSELAFGRREVGSRLQEPARGKLDGVLTGKETLEIQDNGTTGLGESWACNIITKHWIYPV